MELVARILAACEMVRNSQEISGIVCQNPVLQSHACILVG